MLSCFSPHREHCFFFSITSSLHVALSTSPIPFAQSASLIAFVVVYATSLLCVLPVSPLYTAPVYRNHSDPEDTHQRILLHASVDTPQLGQVGSDHVWHDEGMPTHTCAHALCIPNSSCLTVRFICSRLTSPSVKVLESGTP